MLKNTFHHIPGIGLKKEEQLWDSGITSWATLAEPDQFKLSSKKMDTLVTNVRESICHFDNNDPNYFEDLLPANLHWRFFPEFRHETVYLDIETTGLDAFSSEITTIAMYDGKSVYYYVKGDNLDDFLDDLEKYRVIVSYNGKGFDVPFIENYFGVNLDQAHIDLRFILQSLGYKGGLKKCEHALGINRGELDGVDGYFAVLLWDDYIKKNNKKALETLLAYNIEDVINLETLMVMAYNMKIDNTPFSQSHEIPLPDTPEIPFKADIETIEKIKQKLYYY